MIREQEIPKYLKHKESNVSKAKKKLKHKHQYKECLIQYYYNWYKEHEKYKTSISTSLCSYCSICGKIGTRFEKNRIVTDYLKQWIPPIGKCYQHITDKELYERYHDRLPVFFVEDIFNGYVNLNQEGNQKENNL